MEIWKKIDGFKNYECSNTGFIKTFNWKNSGQERIMKPAPDANGYLRTMLKTNEGKFITIKVHRIICKTFKGDLKGMCVNHIDFNRTNNNIENLEWVTIQENNKHSLNNNNLFRGDSLGEKHPKALLTEKQVLEIRKIYIPQKRGLRLELANKYKVSIATIKDVVSRRSWKHI